MCVGGGGSQNDDDSRRQALAEREIAQQRVSAEPDPETVTRRKLIIIQRRRRHRLKSTCAFSCSAHQPASAHVTHRPPVSSLPLQHHPLHINIASHCIGSVTASDYPRLCRFLDNYTIYARLGRLKTRDLTTQHQIKQWCVKARLNRTC